VSEIYPVLLTATKLVVPLTTLSPVLATTPVKPLPSPTKRCAVTVRPVAVISALLNTPLKLTTPVVLTFVATNAPTLPLTAVTVVKLANCPFTDVAVTVVPLITPTTSSFAFGFTVPMPTLPLTINPFAGALFTAA
jgi:hypothetical protein